MSRAVWRWAAGTTLLMLAGAAWHGWQAAPQSPDTAPAVAAASAPHLALPSAAPPGTAAPAVASAPAPAAAQAASPRDGEGDIGSEGFGPHVQRALDSGDPRQALEAARWIASCRPDMDVEAMIKGTHPKYRLVLAADKQAEVINNERQTQRRCQTLTAEQRAQHGLLALRALEAKLPGAGLAYHQSLNPESRTPAELERALRGLRADAEQGQEMAVPVLALGQLGQTRAEQLAYRKLLDLLILKDILPPTNALTPPQPPDPPYTAEEQAEAAGMVRRLWPRLQRPG